MSIFLFRHSLASPDRTADRRTDWQSVLRLLGFPAALLLAVLAAGCGNGPPQREPPAIEVFVTQPITDQVTDYQDFTGRLTAIKTVDIRARVTGYVKSVPFKEGDPVKKGDILFEIDPQTYVADLNQAQANLKLAEADSRLQQKIANRAEQLYRRRSISQEDYETAVATWEKSKAAVKSMEAARDRAKMYVDYTHVSSPLDGRISFRNVDPGNLVNADNTVLTTIVTEDPVYVYFDVDERTYVELAQSATRGQSAWFAKLQFPVLMRLATEDTFTRVGTADFIDNRINANTGTIRMRGIFQNPKGYLKSGLFARIRLPVGNPYPALLIPDEALQSDQGQKFLYVVNDKNEVVRRDNLELGHTIETLRDKLARGHGIETLRVIKKGLKKGERVIVAGMQRVRPGVKVQAKKQAPPKRPKSSLQKVLAMAKSEIRNPKQIQNPKKENSKPELEK